MSASPTAKRVDLLKMKISKILATRETIPHELFWSLVVGEFEKLQSERKADFEERIKKVVGTEG